MSLKEISPEENGSDSKDHQGELNKKVPPEEKAPENHQSIKDINAGRDVNFWGDTIQTFLKGLFNVLIIIKPCPFNSQHGRFIRNFAVGVSIVLIVGGFIKLSVERYASPSVNYLLITGNVPLLLTWIYHIRFGKPIPDKELSRVREYAEFSINTCSEDYEYQVDRAWAAIRCDKIQRDEIVKQNNRSKRRFIGLKCLASIGIVAFPLLTYSGYYSLTNYISSHTTLLTLADFYQEPHGGDGRGITRTIFNGLMNATNTEDDRTDITIQRLNKVIKQAGRADAQNEGKNRLADMVVWGSYDQKPEIVSSYFELLKAPPDFPKKVGWSSGESRTILVETQVLAELNHEMRSHTSPEMAYLTLFAVGLTDYKNGDYQTAINRFDAALKQAEVFKEPVSDLDLSFVYFWRGNAYFYNALFSNSGVHYDRAVKDFTKAIELNPEYALVPYGWSNTYADQGNYSVILADYKISQRDRNLDESGSDREIVCPNQDRDDYIITSNSSSQLRFYLAKIHNNRGIAYAMKGDNNKALADYAEALRLDRDIDEVCNNLGIAYTDGGKYKSAIKNFDRAISVYSEDALAYNNRGNAYIHQNNYDQAIKDYDNAIKINSDFDEAHYNRGVAYLLQKKHKKAVEDFNKVIELKPFAEVYLAEVYHHLGIAYYGQDDCKQAVEHFREAIRLKPDYVNAYLSRGKCLLIMDDNGQAYEDFNKVTQLNPDAAEGYNDRGYSLLRQGDYERGLRDFNRAIQLNPDLDVAYLRRGLAYSGLGDEIDARKDFQKVIALTKNPDLRQRAEQQLQRLQVEQEPQSPSAPSVIPIPPSNQPSVAPVPNQSHAVPPSKPGFTFPKLPVRVPSVPGQRKRN